MAAQVVDEIDRAVVRDRQRRDTGLEGEPGDGPEVLEIPHDDFSRRGRGCATFAVAHGEQGDRLLMRSRQSGSIDFEIERSGNEQAL
ncbi:MAG: hypothetical protein ABTQ32_16880 [Myxococcaceae bacterium]